MSLGCRVAMAMVAVTGCSAGTDRPAAREEWEAAGAVPQQSYGSLGAPATMHIVLGSGPHAGRYDIDATRRTCSHGLVGRNAWANQFAREGAKPSAVHLLIPDARGAREGTDDFALRVTFGDVVTGTHYVIDRTHAGGSGEGVAGVTEGASTATLTVDGQTEDGVELRVSIECREVHRVADDG